MRAAYAVALAVIAGVLFAFVDLLDTLTPWNFTVASWLYYTGLNGIALLLTLLLVYAVTKVFTARTVLLAASAFFAIQSLWNIVYAVFAVETHTLSFPLNLGLGMYAGYNQYYIGLLVQLLFSFIAYVIYRASG